MSTSSSSGGAIKFDLLCPGMVIKLSFKSSVSEFSSALGQVFSYSLISSCKVSFFSVGSVFTKIEKSAKLRSSNLFFKKF
jgi:hypothetical protein